MSTTEYDREVCTMQNAETVLNVIRERGERGLPLENIYRLLYNRELYLRATVVFTQTREQSRPSRPERERPTGKAQVGTSHGGAAAQDPRGLPSLPPERPRRRLATAQATE